jgi:hypothetical protein
LELINVDSKKRNRRRSKNDNDGRSYRCQNCGKAYLSYPALYTHIKTKHDLQGAGSGKGRGRPKKDIGVTLNTIKLLYNPATFDFFKHPERTGETSNLHECLETVFNDVYLHLRNTSEELSTKITPYHSASQHPFFLKIIEIFQNPRTPDENSKCEEVFAFYIYKVSKLACPEFFTKVLKFITLFRECLNQINKDKCKTKTEEISYEYSELFNAEDAPDISNEFVTEFLGPDSMIFDFSREEAIDITQNFCQWMYDNNYTCSKLSLISNY